MGYAIPASIGAYQGNEKPTFVFTGDGGAQMNIQELNTIVKNKLPIKIFVFNNRALGNIVMFQDVTFDKRHYATMEKENDYFSCDFYKIAEAYGMKGIYIDDYKKIVDYKNDLESNEAVLFDIAYEDCEALPGIVAGGDYLGGRIIANLMYIESFRKLYSDGKIKWSSHGLVRMQERDITIDDVANCILNGEIIEEYIEQSPAKDSVLIYGKTLSNKVIHIVL